MTTVPAAVQRAVVQSGYGEPAAVLSLSHTYPVSPPAPGQVQVQVHAASVNPIDWQLVLGNRRLITRRTFPYVLLSDLAGVVTAVGAGVTRFAVGDAVHADNEKGGGGAAELVNVDEDLVSHKPVSLSFAEAAAVPLAAQTALLTMDRGAVGPGSRVCVIGASGGVGSFAVQLAKTLGAAYVVGVCSRGNDEFVRSLGADETIDHTRTTLRAALHDRPVDVVVDCVGGREQWLQARRVLLRNGRFVTISRDEDGKVTPRAALSMITRITARRARSRWGARIDYIPVFLHASHSLLDRVDELLEAKLVRVPLRGRYQFTLAGILDVIGESRRGRMVGKSVVDILPEP